MITESHVFNISTLHMEFFAKRYKSRHKLKHNKIKYYFSSTLRLNGNLLLMVCLKLNAILIYMVTVGKRVKYRNARIKWRLG